MIVTQTGELIGVGPGPNQWIDGFRRANGDLGLDWIDIKTLAPNSYEPVGVYNHGVVCLDAKTRPGVYAADQLTEPGDLDGELYYGIGGAVRETGSTEIRIDCNYNGLWTPPVHTEGGPLFHVTPGTDAFGFGYWLTIVSGNGILAVGDLGDPPEEWAPVGAVAFPVTEGEDVTIGGYSNGTGILSYINGIQIPMSPFGLDPIPVPVELQESTLHGFCFDTHLVDDYLDVPTTIVHKSVSFYIP